MNRVDDDTNTVVLELQDKKNIMEAIDFYNKDVPADVSWSEITSLSDLLIGVNFKVKGQVTVECKLLIFAGFDLKIKWPLFP